MAGLTLLASGLAMVSVATGPSVAASAATVGSARPIAIAVDSSGTSYVGYASGGALSRISTTGRLRPAVSIEQDGPVIGLAVDTVDRVWVADNDSITRMSGTGAVLRRLARPAPDTCDDNAVNSSRRYGGLAIGGGAVYVASRCSPVLEVYDKRTGNLRSSVALPGTSRARGLAWIGKRGRTSPRLFVAIPNTSVVLTYNAATLRDGSSPAKRTSIKRPGRGKEPVPAGLAVDRAGRLTVTDAGNHAVYLYSTDGRYQRYRVLGHPSTASDDTGHLDLPTAVAQYAQDGSSTSGNLFIADTRNGRVQRWDSGGGYTFWMKALRRPSGGGTDPVDPTEPDPPAQTGAPVNTVAPRISPDAARTTLLCDPGTWSGGAASYSYRWLRDGVVRPGMTDSSYALTVADEGTEITCRVTATNAKGSATVTSDPWYVGSPTLPANTSRPTITGTPQRDNTLLCSTGSWSGTPAPRFSYVWLRDSVQIANTPSYRVRSADLGTSLSCAVIATNQAGSSSATSEAVVPEGIGTGEDPTTGPCSGSPRVQINGGAARTKSPVVTLRIIKPNDATGVEVSNLASFASAQTVAVSASCAASWRLVAPSSDATPASVFVRWVGGTAAGQVVSDQIRFDRTAPKVTRAVVRFAKKKWRLRVRASDASALRTVQFSSARANKGRTVRYSREVRIGSPRAARWVRVTDQFGNRSRWVRTS